MAEKDFSLSVGIRATLLGYDAVASYTRLHGNSCIRGKLYVNGDASGLIGVLDKELSEKVRLVLPKFLSQLNAEVSFSFGYDHQLFAVDTNALRFTAISLKDPNKGITGSGFLCAVTDDADSGAIAEIIKTA